MRHDPRGRGVTTLPETGPRPAFPSLALQSRGSAQVSGTQSPLGLMTIGRDETSSVLRSG
jgi:hypothetical protein